MRAVIVREFGPAERAAVGEMPDPVPAPNEVLVEVHADAANYVDLLVIGGKYQFLPKLPFVPGKGPAGIVRAAGSAVTGLQPRDRVLPMAGQGGYAAAVAGAAQHSAPPPGPISDVCALAVKPLFRTPRVPLCGRRPLS